MSQVTTATLLMGKTVADQLLEDVQKRVTQLKEKSNVTPGLVVVRVGEDPASVVYVNKKAKTANKLGLMSRVNVYPENYPEADLLKAIDDLNADPSVHAILVQLPLPAHINSDKVLNRVAPKKDVDGFHPVNLGTLMSGKMPVAPPCTPAGIMKILEHYNIPIAGRHAVVIGRSKIVGKPVGMMLLEKNATVTFCHSKTNDLESVIRQGDIVVAAVGKPGLVHGDALKPGACVIDVGINRITLPNGESKIVGDVDFESAAGKASAITPVPGGVGPMTIATLMANTIALCEAQLSPAQ